MNATKAKPGRELTLTRTLNAPRELVWKVWTDAKHLAAWWGPTGFTNPRCEIDLRAGGEMHIDMRGPDGTVYPMLGTFRVIEPPHRLVFESGALDESGKPMFTVLNSVTLVEQGAKTLLTMHAQVIFETPAAEGPLSGQEEGWNQTLDKLVAHVGAMQTGRV